MTDDLTMLGDEQLADLIGELDEDERSMSKRRARLHDRMDFLRGGGAQHSPVASEQLRQLEDEERRLSDARRELHARLTAAHAERTRRRRAA
ncbi:MAG: hypothetical protein ACKVUT_14905 [Gaiella sp.]